MTVYCESCKSSEGARRGSFSSSPCRTDTITPKFCRRFRSTKGASKARRDHINGEIRNMRSLLPIPAEEQERLSYLHSMALICTYIRKSVLYRGERHEGRQSDPVLPCDFLPALPGFIVAMTGEGKLVYISENVSDYLGLSMVDILQGDTFYDMIDSSCVDLVRENLEGDSNPLKEVSFVCQMHTSKAFRLQHGSLCTLLVRGRLQDAGPQGSLFVALCSPTANRLRPSDLPSYTTHFRTIHRPDMSFLHAPYCVLFHLGHTSEELTGQSWYSLIHPEDLSIAACAHKSMIEMVDEPQVELVVRLQCKDLSWAWLYISAAKSPEKEEITCSNFIISETEAMFLKQHLYNNSVRVRAKSFSSPPASHEPLSPGACSNTSPKRRHDSCQSVEESRKRTRLTEPSTSVVAMEDNHLGNQEGVSHCLGHGTTVFCSPPYSPASAHSPLTQGESMADYLVEEQCGVTEGMLSPPSGSPHYSPSISFNNNNSSSSSSSSRVVDRPEPSNSYTPTLMLQNYNNTEAFARSSFEVVSSPISPGAESVFAFPDCANDSCLVPGYQPLDEVYESQAECVLHPEDFNLLPMVAPMDLGGSEPPQELPPPPTSHEVPPRTPTQTSEAVPVIHPQQHYSEHEHEQVEISLLARQISSLASSFNAYCIQGLAPVVDVSPHHQVTPLGWPQHGAPLYLPMAGGATTAGPETVLDESTIDCILKDLDGMLGSRAEGWGQLEVAQFGRRPLAQQHDLSLAALVDCLPAEEFGSSTASSHHSTADLRSNARTECQDQSAGLHQLHQYAHCSIPQDGLTEESMF
ncbi:neuronal PAS domain-containing protein 4-like [Engraulis encrasicolus]|uniref:neuronal PAS domain-containing protein 4-like n=1 Tax=Engraulis encrasicolus TaxID=184585 RepID=UPI002FCFAD76